MNYFDAISTRADELTEAAEKIVSGKPFRACQDCAFIIAKAADEIFNAAKARNGGSEDWESIPRWVANVEDGYIQYYSPPENGSLYYALGWSQAAQDCNLRLYAEAVEAGKDPEKVEYIPCLAEKEIVIKYTKEKP